MFSESALCLIVLFSKVSFSVYTGKITYRNIQYLTAALSPVTMFVPVSVSCEATSFPSWSLGALSAMWLSFILAPVVRHLYRASCDCPFSASLMLVVAFCHYISPQIFRGIFRQTPTKNYANEKHILASFFVSISTVGVKIFLNAERTIILDVGHNL